MAHPIPRPDAEKGHTMTPADAAHADGTGYPPAQGATAPSKAAPPADIEVAFGDDAAGAVGAVGSAEPLESAAATEIGDGDHEPTSPDSE